MPSTSQHRELLWFFLMPSKVTKSPTSPCYLPSLTGLLLKVWRVWWSAHLHRLMYIEHLYPHPCTGWNVTWRPACHLLMVQKSKTRPRCFSNREPPLAHTKIPLLSSFSLFLALTMKIHPQIFLLKGMTGLVSDEAATQRGSSSHLLLSTWPQHEPPKNEPS